MKEGSGEGKRRLEIQITYMRLRIAKKGLTNSQSLSIIVAGLVEMY